jgi:hypothetical protein
MSIQNNFTAIRTGLDQQVRLSSYFLSFRFHNLRGKAEVSAENAVDVTKFQAMDNAQKQPHVITPNQCYKGL